MSKIVYVLAAFALVGVLFGTFHSVAQRQLAQSNTVDELWSAWK
jgi:hypothetical protein